MPAKIIVSYDGTANEDDAVALGRLLGQAGADVALAYVSHAPDSAGDTQGILNRGLSLLGNPNAATHVVTDRSTPNGLAALAEAEQADIVVFCSDSHTAKGHVSIGNSAERLLQGKPENAPGSRQLRAARICGINQECPYPILKTCDASYRVLVSRRRRMLRSPCAHARAKMVRRSIRVFAYSPA